jgi:hypothetical protein
MFLSSEGLDRHVEEERVRKEGRLPLVNHDFKVRFYTMVLFHISIPRHGISAPGARWRRRKAGRGISSINCLGQRSRWTSIA